MLEGKKIILGITGGIAAYKAAFLVRQLVKAGAEVKVVMSPMAKEFITPLTMATLSKNPILVDFYNPENGDWNSHVDLGLWADAYVIAPATANTLAKMANAIADNLLLTTYLSARCPVFVAPAMDFDMFLHPANQKNMETLESYGNIVITPGSGELASGLEGKGRMAEPELIVEALENHFAKNRAQDLAGKKMLITAGPTYEAIDPVRYLGNHSSGKMGYALAEEAASRGASVVLISGPTNLQVKSPDIELMKVTSALEMHDACLKQFPLCDAGLMVAAVADYTPKEVHAEKLKNKQDSLNIELVKTKDIAAELGKLKTKAQILAGFALETQHEEANASAKLKNKNFDFIVLNSLKDAGAGFQVDTNKISILDKFENKTAFEVKSKALVAKDIIDKLVEMITA